MPRHECPGGHFAGGTTMPTTPVCQMVRVYQLAGNRSSSPSDDWCISYIDVYIHAGVHSAF